MSSHDRVLCVLFSALLLGACGGSGGGGDDGSVVAGTVRSPNGQSIGFSVSQAPSHPLARPFELGGRAAIEIPGLAPVPDGTTVELVRLDAAGAPLETLDSTTTSAGRYSFDLVSLDVVPTSDLAVRAGSGATILRALVCGSELDVDPMSEAIVRLVLAEGTGFAAFTLEELADLTAALELLAHTQELVALPDLSATIALFVQTAQGDPGFDAFLTACGFTGQTDEGPGDIGDYFPADVGDVWGYAGTRAEGSGAPEAYTKSRRITARDVDGNVTAKDEESLDGGSTTNDLLLETSAGVLFLGNDDPTDPQNQVVPFEFARFPLRPGERWEQFDARGLSLGVDLDQDQQDEVVDLSSQQELVGFEDLVLPAGAFDDCARFETSAVITVHFTAGPLVRNTVTESIWFAPGIGPVRRETVSILSGATVLATTTLLERLESYQVGTVGRGILPATELALDVSAANSDVDTPGRPAIAFDGTNYLLVTCREGAVAQLVGILLAPTGVVLEELELYPLGATAGNPRPGVTFDGTNYLVVFQNSGQIIGLRVSPAGDVLDSLGIPISTTGASNFSPAVAFDGTNALVVWRKFDNLLLGEIYGARVTPLGSALGEFVVRSSAAEQQDPALVFGGENYLVAWSDEFSGTRSIRAARIAPDETILDAGGFGLTTATGQEDAPQLAFDGTRYLVVYSSRTPSLSAHIRAVRVEQDGTLADAAPISICNTNRVNVTPSVVFDGTNYLVAWAIDSVSAPSGVFAARLSPAGVLLDGSSFSGGIEVAAPPDLARLVYPQLARGAANILLAWTVNLEQSGEEKDVGGTLVYPF